ncbi:hypothetical protein V8E55_011975 [Tylopilus felleus]
MTPPGPPPPIPDRSKQVTKGVTDPTTRRPTWSRARASPTFSPANPSHTNNTRSQDAPQDLLFQTLSGLTDATIILSTKTGQRYEGVISSTSPEGDTAGVTLKDVKEISKPGTPLKNTLFISSTNIENWQFGAADAKLHDSETLNSNSLGRNLSRD